MVKPISNRPNVCVSFSGVDGAGKSTQIEALASYFRQQGLRVEVIPFWDRVAWLTDVREKAGHRFFKGEKGIGRPDAPVNRRDKNVRSWPMSWVRLGLYLFDAVATRRAVRDALQSDSDFVIFDRYIYDELANLNLRNPMMRAYARWVMGIVPRPAVSYLLDADPQQARARKPEYPVEFISINRQAYFDLSSLVGGITVVPPLPVHEVQREVLHHAIAALSDRLRQPDRKEEPLSRAS
jgi:thymidylate kinase